MNPFINNWMFGEVSPKLAGRFDLAMSAQGCEVLNNFRPMTQGGITRRPPLVSVVETTEGRLIPFTISGGESFLIQLSSGKIHIWREGINGLELIRFLIGGIEVDFRDSPYLNTSLWSVQFSQYYDRMYFAHRDFKQMVLLYSAGAFSFEPYTITVEDSSYFGRASQNYPGVVAVSQNRLWFGSTHAQPYTMWASRPHEDDDSHRNFLHKDVVVSQVEVLKDPMDWPLKEDGTYDLTNAEALKEIIEETDEVVTARCSMQLELSSGRNDRIEWISGMNNIMVGTGASEWLLPFDIDPTKQNASMKSAYGSDSIQAVVLNDGIFYIQHGNKLREYAVTANGEGSYDLSYTADHMLKAGIRQMVSMRVPEPMIVCLLENNTLAVLSYDRMYQLQGWARWDTQGSFISISTKETEEGQRLYAIVRRDDKYFIEVFDFDEKLIFRDRANALASGDLQYESLMVGNLFDFQSEGGTSIGRAKKAREVWIRCLESGRVSTGVDELYMQTTKNPVGSADQQVNISGGSRRELRVRVKAYESDPLTVLAMTYEVEVN